MGILSFELDFEADVIGREEVDWNLDQRNGVRSEEWR